MKPLQFLKRALLLVATLALVGTPASAQSTNTPSSPPILGVPIDVNYVLGLGDVLEISLVGRNDYTARVRIEPDGTIQLPLIGRQPAVNKTVTGLADDIRGALEKGKFYSQVAVRVDVIAVSSRYVTVLGQVGTPSLVPLDRGYRLSEILAKVGGRGGNSADYVVITRADGVQNKYPIAGIAMGGAQEDPEVTPGDKIFIPSLENEIFFVIGAVGSPGQMPLTPGLTVRMALARAGGVTQMGNDKKVDVMRNGKKVRGVPLDSEVQRGDIIDVRERLF